MIRKTVEGREFESQMIGELNFDQTPKEGSFNPVTSDGVAKAVTEAVENLEEKIDEVTLDPSAVALGNVHLLDKATEFSAGAGVLVDSEQDGPKFMEASKLLELTAQNAIAGNEAEAFDETGATTYKAGKAVVRGGKTYIFKVDHSGVWSAADVERSYINDCGVVDNGGIGNPANLYKVKTRILPFDITKPLIINVTKPLRASGNYYKVGYQLVTNDALIGRYAVLGDYAYSNYVLSEAGVRAGTQFTLVNQYLGCKGIALEILEYDSLGNYVANRKEDFVGYSVQLIQPCEPYQVFFNGGIGNPANATKVHSKIIPVAGGHKYIINLSKQVKNSGDYFKIGYILTSNYSNIGKDAADVFSGGSFITKVDAGLSTGLRIEELLDLSSFGGAVGIGFELNEYNSTDTVVTNRFDDFYEQTLSLVPYIANRIPMHLGSIPDGGTLAYLEDASGGHLKWSYRSQENRLGVMNVGTAMATFTNTSVVGFKHIDYIQSPRYDKFPFMMETDGTRHRIVNVSGHSLEISTIFCAGSWKYADNWSAPAGWISGSAVEEGAINNLFNKTREASVDFSTLNAIARINVASNGSKDFCSLIVTDSHADDSSVTRAIDYSGKATAVSATLHCGDYVADSVSYGQTTSGWSLAVANSVKPTYFVQGNHEKGTYKNIALTPSDDTLYDLFVKPIVDKGYLAVGEYETNKCYYYHDFGTLKTRLIVLDEYRAPTDYDETYWEAITYDSSLSDIVGNTDYAIGAKVNVPGFTANSFQAVQAVNTGAYYSGKRPCYKCRRGYRYIDQTEAQWFLDTLYSTPSDYVVVVAMHNPFSDLAVPDKSKKFCQQVNIPDDVTGAGWAQNYMATDFVADALNAFKTGVSYSATISTKSDSEAAYIADYSVAKDFSVRGEGKLGVIIGGHVHRDVIWKHTTYTYMYQVTPMCSITTESAFNKSADIRLQNDTQYEDYVDSLTAFAVADGRVALAKLGCKYTTDALVRDIEVL